MNDQPINIHCASCGAPAHFDIARQTYLCQYCGSQTGIQEALAQKRGFRKLHRQRMREKKRDYPLVSCSCTGCGAEVVFPENEALASCSFCGRALARKEYLGVQGFPEILIPFKVTQDEARSRLLAWCDDNRHRPEANDLRAHAGDLLGFYLPYELVKGPTTCIVRGKASRLYHCRGFLEGSFVNTSGQLDNLLLDGMEPYDLEGIKEFDFSYLAGQRVKMRDTNDKETASRVAEEIASDYEPYVAKVMETHDVHVEPNTDSLLQMATVLPAYYVRAGSTIAAVNGQTGKVAVREAKDRFLLPWWPLPILWTAVFCAVIYGAMRLFGAENGTSLVTTGAMALFLLITLFTAYSDAYGGRGKQRLRRRVFTSDKSRPKVDAPQFFETIDGSQRPVVLRFTTPLRVLRQIATAIVVVFLPVIIAFLLNGLSMEGLHLEGAAVWFCITVPVAPVYLLKFGRIDLYEHPLMWVTTEDGKRRRWRGPKKTFSERVGQLREGFRSGCITILVVLGALALLLIQVALILSWDQI